MDTILTVIYEPLEILIILQSYDLQCNLSFILIKLRLHCRNSLNIYITKKKLVKPTIDTKQCIVKCL